MEALQTTVPLRIRLDYYEKDDEEDVIVTDAKFKTH
jgi:hypothetical protein